MSKRNKKEDTLDTETTFADMNVEGFRWYNPQAKKNGNAKNNKQKMSRKEYRQLLRAAFAAYAPVFLIVTLVFGIMACLAWIWIG